MYFHHAFNLTADGSQSLIKSYYCFFSRNSELWSIILQLKQWAIHELEKQKKRFSINGWKIPFLSLGIVNTITTIKSIKFQTTYGIQLSRIATNQTHYYIIMNSFKLEAKCIWLPLKWNIKLKRKRRKEKKLFLFLQISGKAKKMKLL